MIGSLHQFGNRNPLFPVRDSHWNYPPSFQFSEDPMDVIHPVKPQGTENRIDNETKVKYKLFYIILVFLRYERHPKTSQKILTLSLDPRIIFLGVSHSLKVPSSNQWKVQIMLRGDFRKGDGKTASLLPLDITVCTVYSSSCSVRCAVMCRAGAALSGKERSQLEEQDGKVGRWKEGEPLQVLLNQWICQHGSTSALVFNVSRNHTWFSQLKPF